MGLLSPPPWIRQRIFTAKTEFVLSVRAHSYRNYDYPEMCMGGLKLAIEASRPASTIYVITDAAAKDYKIQVSLLSVCSNVAKMLKTKN